MKRSTQNLLYHLLPVVFWLLAIGGCVLSLLFVPALQDGGLERMCYLFPGILSLLCIAILGGIKRHESAVAPCLHVAIVLGIASYWLPGIVFLILPMWIYLAYRHLFSMRVFASSFIGFAIVAIWMTIAVMMEWIANPYIAFFAIKNLWVWLPTGIILIAWLASTIARQNLRER